VNAPDKELLWKQLKDRRLVGDTLRVFGLMPTLMPTEPTFAGIRRTSNLCKKQGFGLTKGFVNVGDTGCHAPRPTTNQKVAGSSLAERALFLLQNARKRKPPASYAASRTLSRKNSSQRILP
jgi:hypothetical protein